MAQNYRPSMTQPMLLLAPDTGGGASILVLDRSVVAADLGSRSFVVGGPSGTTLPMPLSELMLTANGLSTLQTGVSSWYPASDGVAGGELRSARYAGIRFTTTARDNLIAAGYNLPTGLRQRALDLGSETVPEFDPTNAQTVEAPRLLPELPHVAVAIPIGLSIIVGIVALTFLILAFVL